jgi:hypothetical protein
VVVNGIRGVHFYSPSSRDIEYWQLSEAFLTSGGLYSHLIAVRRKNLKRFLPEGV